MNTSAPSASSVCPARVAAVPTLKPQPAATLASIAACAALLGACNGGGSSDPTPPPPGAVRFVAPEDGSFVAAVNPANPNATLVAPAQGSYAGKRLFRTATVNTVTQTFSGYAASTIVYKGANGGIFKMDLLTTTAPAPVPLSSESAATLDDTCSYNPGPNLVGTFVTSDFVNPANSAYFYRVPGPSGQCGKSDDIVRMVKQGMSATDAPIPALMPLAVARSAAGAVTGYVAVQGSTVTLFDANFANARVLYTAPAPIALAYRLSSPPGVASTSGVFSVDGNIVYLDYANASASALLMALAQPMLRALAASSAEALYFVDTATSGSAASSNTSSTVYRMPLNGTSGPVALAVEPTRITALQLPLGSSTLVYSVTPAGGSYTLKSLPVTGGTPTTVLATAGNAGSFSAVSSNVYYTSSTRSSPAARTFVFSNTRSGVVRNDGAVVVPEVANSRFTSAAERDDTLTTTRLFRVRNLAPVTTLVASNNETITDDGAAGGTLEAFDVSTNLAGAALGTVPGSSITFLDAGLIGDTGFVVGTTRNSSGNPAGSELMFVNATQGGSLLRISNNLP